MSSLRNIVLGCVSEHSHETPEATNFSPPKRLQKVKFNVALANTLVDGELPDPLVNIIVYIARDGVATSDLFRRPGSHADLKVIVRRLAEGYPIQLSDYNFYTLASVVKMFLLKIPGGLFGSEVEQRLLEVLELNSRLEQCDAIHCIIASLPTATQRLVVLLFGTWFRVVNHCEYNAMTSEAMAKSIAGSIFHTCATKPSMVNNAVRLIRIIIDNFGAPSVLGAANVQYFTEQTCTAIKVRERFKYQLTGTCPLVTSGSSDAIRVDFSDECHQRFYRVVKTDAACRGFDTALNAISEREFYSNSGRPASTHELYTRRISAEANCTSASEPGRPSPSLSLCMPNCTSIDNHEQQHVKLAHHSSLSAPDVNQGCDVSQIQNMSASPCNSASYVSVSLNRFDSVRRRQLQRLRKRSDWFLSPPQGGASTGSSTRSPTHCGDTSETAPASAPDRVRFLGIDDSEPCVRLPKLCFDIADQTCFDLPPSSSVVSNDNIDGSVCNTLQTSSVPNDRLSSSPCISSNSDNDDLSSHPTTSNCLPLLSESSPLPSASDEYIDQSDVHYFIVDRFYGNKSSTTVATATTNGNSIQAAPASAVD